MKKVLSHIFALPPFRGEQEGGLPSPHFGGSRREALFILFSLFFVSATITAESIYRIDFSKAQAGWDCVQYTGKPWKFLENAFYDNGTYYSAVTMERNYSSTSTAKYMLSSGVKLSPGK